METVREYASPENGWQAAASWQHVEGSAQVAESLIQPINLEAEAAAGIRKELQKHHGEHHAYGGHPGSSQPPGAAPQSSHVQNHSSTISSGTTNVRGSSSNSGSLGQQVPGAAQAQGAGGHGTHPSMTQHNFYHYGGAGSSAFTSSTEAAAHGYGQQASAAATAYGGSATSVGQQHHGSYSSHNTVHASGGGYNTTGGCLSSGIGQIGGATSSNLVGRNSGSYHGHQSSASQANGSYHGGPAASSASASGAGSAGGGHHHSSSRSSGNQSSGQHGGSSSSSGQAGIYQYVLDLRQQDRREAALYELSKRRENLQDLAPILWHSFGTIAALCQEIIGVYPQLSSHSLTATSSNRVCNSLALLQCLASDTETRPLFLRAQIPLLLYPFLNTHSQEKPYEYLRLTSLGVIGALVKVDDTDVAGFLLQTEIIPLCLRIMETGSELSKTVATFILQKLLLDETGLAYITQTAERFYQVATVLNKMVDDIRRARDPAARLLKHVVRCFLRLSDNERARDALRRCLPDALRSGTELQPLLESDATTKRWLQTLLQNLATVY
ncbi:unnamed protein product [Amoebophrya sp. A25]|nr:unnamed protein product [Amoebophrya sp. A25]|eukprot:GSA25T00024719001.1